MDRLEIINEIVAYIQENIGFDNIVKVESNCGSIWFDLKDGQTVSLQTIECEPAEESDEED